MYFQTKYKHNDTSAIWQQTYTFEFHIAFSPPEYDPSTDTQVKVDVTFTDYYVSEGGHIYNANWNTNLLHVKFSSGISDYDKYYVRG